MSNRAVRITLRNPPMWLPAFYQDDDGKYSFDLNTDTDIAITKQIDDISNVGSIKQDTVRNFKLPITKKNIILFGDYGNPAAFNFFHNKPLEIEITVGLLTLAETEFRVKVTGDKDFEVEAFGEANAWIDPLGKLAIKELEFGLSGNFNFNYVATLHQQNYAYNGIQAPVNIPYANYGKRSRPGLISIEDLRFWHNAYYILREGFCKIGWTLNCPMMESELGRRIWIYILAENFADSAAATSKGFNAILDNDVALEQFSLAANGTVIFDNDSVPPAFDNGNLYSTITGRYDGTGLRADYIAVLQIDGNLVVTPGYQNYLYFEIRKINTVSGIGTTLKLEVIYDLINGINTFTLRADDVYLNPDEQIFVIALGGGFTGTIKAQASRFYNIPKADVIKENDIVDLQAIIHDDYKVLDVLKGIAHIFNFKVDTDSDNKIVSAYPEDGGDWYSEGNQEAFFYPNAQAKDWTDKVKCDSMDVQINTSKNKRNSLFQFKNDNGDFKAKNTQFAFPLHAKNINFGDLFKEGTEKLENPFFAPTINDFDFEIGWIDDTGTNPNAAPWLPFFWSSDTDNNGEAPKPNTKIAPRILLAYPLQRMVVPAYKENPIETFGDLTLYNTAFPNNRDQQELYAPFAQIFPPGFYGTLGGGLPPVPLTEEALVYGTDEYNPSLEGNYELFYKESLEKLYRTIPVEFLIELSLTDFSNFSPRDRIFIRYNSKRYGEISFYSRVGAITDYVANKKITTPVLLQPNKNFLETNCCNCFVYIEYLGFDSQSNLLVFIVRLAGSCGTINSFEWQHTSIGGDGETIVGDANMQTVTIGGIDDPVNTEFDLDVAVASSCGLYQASISYPIT